uniref:AAA+ ATPase domain-containing protein n=1 Tax=Oryza nivara TaxID=4536 RepID=A0A0E0GX55_ORYNI
MQVISQSGVMPMLDRAKDIISGKTSELKKILNKLEKIIEEGSQFLPPPVGTTGNGTNGSNISNTANKMTGTVTTSSALTEVIIGRDKERDEILRMLHETADDCELSSWNSKCYSVIGIYGIGGSGKTTLAQHVCNYERRDNHFCLIMWVHVSQSFSVNKIYREMLEAASGEPSHEFCNLDSLQMKLEAALTSKRFLLVLDDIWPEKDVNSQYKLDQLLSPLKVGKRGSKVLVTTRFADATMSLGARDPLKVPDLIEKDFLLLFMHYALDGVRLDSRQVEQFQTIGEEIMKKLKGSPLAARLVGARLRKQLNLKFWRRVENQDLLTHTMGALWWSYRHLDGQVKRSFAYCSIFPPGHMFARNELVELWMAEGFIKTTSGDEQMEDIGQNYFDELVSCSFLQTTKTADGSENERFTMHDLLHELATMVSGNDCFRVEEGEKKEFPPDARHLFINLYDPVKATEQICKLKKLRTLIFTSAFGGSAMTIEALEGMLKKLRKLRVVQVCLDGDVMMIPASICGLKHLRCLTVHSFGWTKVNLPRDFDKLYHLQILEIPNRGVLSCSNVKSMGSLISLRHVRNPSRFLLSESSVLVFPWIGELKSLRELSHFAVMNKKGHELQQLKSLNNLHGTLSICGLQNVGSKERALEAKLTDKKHLTGLSLTWSGEQSCNNTDIDVEIIEGLCPPSQITELLIYGYHGWKYPTWLSQNQNCPVTNLQFLHLWNCFNMEALPNIAELFGNLRELRVFNLPRLNILPRLPDGLKRLYIRQCEALVVTCVEDVEMIRSMLIERISRTDLSVRITHPEEISVFASEQPEMFKAILCNIIGLSAPVPEKSENMLSSIMPFICCEIEQENYPQLLLHASLECLYLEECIITDTVLRNCLRSCTCLTVLELEGVPFCKAIPYDVLKPLVELRITDCVHFTHLQGLADLNNLRRLSIGNCPNLETLQESDKVQALDWLSVGDITLSFKLSFCDPPFMKSCQQVGHPNWQKIAHRARKAEARHRSIMAEVAAVGWAISTLGWIASPITTRLLNHGFDLLGFDESDKLRDLEARILPRMALLMEQADRIPLGQRAHLEQWSSSLRSAFYDAEDILDLADYHRLEKQVISRPSPRPTLDRLKHIISGETGKLKKILKKLENIIEEGSQFLPPLTGTISNVTNGIDISNPANKITGIITTSSALTQVIIGRDKERDEIVRMLHETSSDYEPNSSNNKCYSVIGIYGIGGSGKTTLAQHVYCYERTQTNNYFCPIMWVHVSQSFNVGKIYQEMLEAASGKPSHEFSNLDTLQMKLGAELTGKRFLLVLDDIWAEEDVSTRYKLDQLLSPLNVGERGSKVLVTTRSADAAISLGAQSPMQITDLNDNDFFKVFMNYALDGVSLDSQELEELQMIGGEIAKKLKGSPLAARLVGARLRKELVAAWPRRASYTMFWRIVEEQDLLRDTMGALWWSYQQLDGHVKRCFAYCSMFPPGHEFERDNLVKLWMAEDFIEITRSVEQMENVGQNYFDELVSCSFLQARTNTDGSENEKFIMHDLLHDLAVRTSGSDCFRVEHGDQTKEFPPDVRHLYVSSYDPRKLTEICKLKRLRTLIISYGSAVTIEALECMMKKLKMLRVVQSYLYWLHPEEGFPGVGELKSLRELSDFTVRKEKGYELHQLVNLNKLRGSLRISGLQNVESKERALEAKLTEKKHLTALSLVWSNPTEQVCSPDLQLEIIESLCPPSLLKELEIFRYSGLKYPSWLTQSFRCLQRLEIKECFNLKALPDIGELFIHLRTLALLQLPKLEILPRLPDSLKRLDIEQCHSLVLTCVEDVEMIRSLLTEQASHIDRSLNIMIHPEEIDRFANEQPVKFHRIVLDIFGRCDKLPLRLIRGWIRVEDHSQFLFPASMDRLTISDCAITDTVLHNCLRGSTSLTWLFLSELPFIISIPSEVMNSLAMLQHLCITRCAQLTYLQGLNHLSCLRSLEINQCPNLRALQEDEKVQVVDAIYINDIPLLPQLLSREGFSSLGTLYFGQKELREEEEEEEILRQQFASLTSLRRIVFCKWNRLPDTLVNLTCLQSLGLKYCNIRSLPTLPASLRVLTFNTCDKSFVRTCQMVGHPNYQKIAHVPVKEFFSYE